MNSTTEPDRQWMVAYPQRTKPLVQLLCFAAAGTGPAAFARWFRKLPESVEVLAVQFPGRGSRVREPLYRHMHELADVLATQIKDQLGDQVVIFGHSLGALIAFEFVRSLERLGGRGPDRLIVASSRAPHQPVGKTPSYMLDDEALVQRLSDGNAVPPTVLARPSLMQLFMPVWRADSELGEKYRCSENDRVSCPITAMVGEHDQETTADQMQSWERHTESDFQLHTLSGDHFFPSELADDFVDLLTAELSGSAETMP